MKVEAIFILVHFAGIASWAHLAVYRFTKRQHEEFACLFLSPPHQIIFAGNQNHQYNYASIKKLGCADTLSGFMAPLTCTFNTCAPIMTEILSLGP